MLNSQHRIAPQKNIANAQEPTQIFFCVAAMPKDSNASQKRCASTNLFYAISPPRRISQWQSLPAVW